MDKTYYERFGVSEDATYVEIKRVYRRLALKYHPDKNNGDPKYQRIFQQINQIYATLSDPENRRRYDEELFRQRHPYLHTTPPAAPTYQPPSSSRGNHWWMVFVLFMTIKIAGNSCNNQSGYSTITDPNETFRNVIITVPDSTRLVNRDSLIFDSIIRRQFHPSP